MEKHSYKIIDLFNTGITLNVASAITTILTAILTFIVVVFLTRKLTLRPSTKKQNAAELLAIFVKDNAIKSNVSWTKYGKSLWAAGLTLISLLLVANTMGVLLEVSYDHVIYVNSVTADPTFTFALAGMFILYTHYFGIKEKGTMHYLKTYTSSGAGLTPFKILEEFTNLLTLSLRLYGNIYAGEVIIGLLGTLALSGVFGMIIGLPSLVIWKGFSLFIGCIQAYIFTILVFLYLSHKVNDEH